MRAHKIDGSGLIINTIIVDSLSGGLIDASIGGSVGDSITNGALIPAETAELKKKEQHNDY